MNAKVNKVTANIVMEVSDRSISASYAPQFSVRDSLKDHQALILAKNTASAIRLRAKEIRDELVRAQQSMTFK